jgi:hypothetical protein
MARVLHIIFQNKSNVQRLSWFLTHTTIQLSYAVKVVLDGYEFSMVWINVTVKNYDVVYKNKESTGTLRVTPGSSE